METSFDVYQQAVKKSCEEIYEMLSMVEAEEVITFCHSLVSAQRIFFTAAGRSRLVLSCLTMRLMQLGLQVYMIGEVTTPAVKKGDLLVAASGSGETDSVLLTVSKAKKMGVQIAAITGSPNSSLAQLADFRVQFLPRRNSTQIGSAAFEQSVMLFGDACAIITARNMHIQDTTSQIFKLHANLE